MALALVHAQERTPFGSATHISANEVLRKSNPTSAITGKYRAVPFPLQRVDPGRKSFQRSDVVRVQARTLGQLLLRHELLVAVCRCAEGHLHACQLLFRLRIARLGEVVDNTWHALKAERNPCGTASTSILRSTRSSSADCRMIRMLSRERFRQRSDT